MIHIHTRPRGKGGGCWCNATINGCDVSFEGDSIEAAQEQMREYLDKHKILHKQVKWVNMRGLWLND